MGKEEIDKIVIEAYPVVGQFINIETVSDGNKGITKTENKFTTYFHDPENIKITLVIDGANVILYEGRKIKNFSP